MKIRYNRNSELEIMGLGIFKPNQIVTIEDELEAQKYLDSVYFNEIKEKEIKIKRKKSKNKGVDK